MNKHKEFEYLYTEEDIVVRHNIFDMFGQAFFANAICVHHHPNSAALFGRCVLSTSSTLCHRNGEVHVMCRIAAVSLNRKYLFIPARELEIVGHLDE